MSSFWKLMAGYDAESTTYSECAKTNLGSPYKPGSDAQLKAIRVVSNRDAATTLQNHIQFKLTCDTFTPNSIEVGGQGSGLQTAPALSGGVNAQNDWVVDQPVKAGVPITIEGRNITADTPVTVDALVYGYFEN